MTRPTPLPTLLADRLRAGDAAALARLADATYGRAMATARSLGADEAAAERAVLDAYVALWLARHEAPADPQLEAWVLSEVVARIGRAERETVRPSLVERARGWLRAALAPRPHLAEPLA